jgi:hypothetical protein
MTTPLSITSRNQGQIFGSKPTLEELERQLDADPMTRAVNWCGHMFAKFMAVARRMKLPAMPTAVEFRRRDGVLRHLVLK